MPLNFGLPLLVQCRFFNPINCDLGPYFSHGYLFFAFLLFEWKIGNLKFLLSRPGVSSLMFGLLLSCFFLCVFFTWSLIWTGQVFLTILIWRFVLQATVHSLIWIFSLIPVRYFFHTNHTERLPTAHLTAKNVCPTYRLRLTSNFLFSPKLAPQQSYLLYIVELTYRRGIWAAARPDDTPN